ncbi:hypothetical protein D3C72_1313830 [compost metagenome]
MRYFKLPFQPSRKGGHFRCSAGCLVSGAMLLFALVLGYVYRFGYGYGGVTAEQAALFVLLAAGAIALGGMAEGRRWGVGVWLLVTLAFPLWLLSMPDGQSALWWGVAGAMVLHGCAVTVGWGRQKEAAYG